MSIITLISDFGYKDYYISALKAKIYTLIPNINIVDITHGISKFNFREGVFVLKNVMFEFPDNTIHIFAVNEGGELNDNDFYLIKIENQYVIGTGKNFISLFDNNNIKVFKLPKPNESNTFPSYSVFVQAAFQLIKNVSPMEIGELQNNAYQKDTSLIDIQQSGITGTIMHIDDYGNLITNISRTIFEKARDNRNFVISVGREQFTKISKNYYDANASEALCFFNSNNYLVIAIAVGGAKRLFGVSVDSKIKINFN